MLKKNIKIKERLYKMISIILLLFGVFYFYKTNYIPKIYGDEYGYWAAASWFAGMDWSEITRLNGYYGYGYGFILSFFFKTPLLATECYRLAIALNGFFIIVIFFIAHKLAKELLQKHFFKEYEICIVALLATVGTSTLYYTQYTMCELLLTLVYWIIIDLAWLLLKKETKTRMILFLFANAFLTYIHIRSLGIIVVSCMFLFYLFYRNKKQNIKVLFATMVGMAMLLFLGIAIKNLYQDSYLIKDIQSLDSAKNYTSSANDFSAAANAIRKFFSIEGIQNFICNFIGRFYYSIVGSFMLVLIACLGFIQDIYNMYKYKKRINALMVYLILIFGAMLAVSALGNIWGNEGRYDLLTYGRYHEFVIGPLIICGVDYFFIFMKKDNWSRILCETVCIALVIGSIVHTLQIYDGTEGNSYAHSMWVYFWTHKLETKNIIFIAAIMIIVSIFTIATIIWKKSNESKVIFNLCLCGLLLFNIYASLYSYEKGCLSWSQKLTNGALSFEQEIVDKGYSVFYLNESHLFIEPYQILLKEQKVHIINNLDDYYNVQNESTILLLSYKTELDINSLYDLKCMGEYGWISAWK